MMISKLRLSDIATVIQQVDRFVYCRSFVEVH